MWMNLYITREFLSQSNFHNIFLYITDYLFVSSFQRNDISLAISKFDQFDFLIDIVPRDVETKPAKRVRISAYYLSLSIKLPLRSFKSCNCIIYD